jgi:hypothetical protein
MAGQRTDPVAAAATTLTVAMVLVYLSIIHQQSGRPATWFVVLLLVAAASTGYASYRRSPRRRPVLALSGIVLIGAGLLALLSIGVPILAAGVLCEIAAARSAGRGTPAPSATP